MSLEEKEAKKAYKGCIIAKTCNLVKCPTCGYESPVESKLIKKIIP